MTTTACLKFAPTITVLVLLAFPLASAPQDATEVSWTPPAARKAKTPFAPKLPGGNNIFKGEAEVWLADAVEKLEGETSAAIDDELKT